MGDGPGAARDPGEPGRFDHAGLGRQCVPSLELLQLFAPGLGQTDSIDTSTATASAPSFTQQVNGFAKRFAGKLTGKVRSSTVERAFCA